MRVPTIALLILSSWSPLRSQQDGQWLTYYELSGGRRTPRYAETIEFCRRLDAASPWIQYTSFGVSSQGRELLSGETALAAFGYLLAHALFLDRASWRSRALALFPSVCVLLVWALVYRYFNFGSTGSGTYHDPAKDLPTFLGSLFLQAPLLLAAQWSSVPADLANIVPKTYSFALLLTCLLVMTVIGCFFSSMLRRNHLARFWCVGMLISLIPVSATFPSGRLLSFVALGAAGVLAHFTAWLVSRSPFVPAGTYLRVVEHGLIACLLTAKLVIAPLMIPLAAYTLKSIDDSMTAAIDTVPDDDRIARQDLVILNPPDQLYYGAYIFVAKTLQGKPIPSRLRVLAAGPTEMEIVRIDRFSLRARIPGGLFAGPFGRSFRSKNVPLNKGDQIRIPGMTALIQEVNSDGDPTEVIYQFSRSLDDDRFRLLRWKNGEGYVSFVPPAIGDSTVFPPSKTPHDIF